MKKLGKAEEIAEELEDVAKIVGSRGETKTIFELLQAGNPKAGIQSPLLR